MSNLNDDIKDAIRFARSMGVKDAIWVFLTPDMLKAVCRDADPPQTYDPDDLGRMYIGRYTFVQREGMSKALVLQPHTIPASFLTGEE